MAMNFNRPAQQTQTAAPAPAQTMEIVEVKPYDIVADREETSKALAHSPEVEALTAPSPPRRSPRLPTSSCGA